MTLTFPNFDACLQKNFIYIIAHLSWKQCSSLDMMIQRRIRETQQILMTFVS